MVQAAPAWDFEVDRGPDWLFIRPHGATVRGQQVELAEQVCQLLEQCTAHRVVLELDDVSLLNSLLIAQLLLLRKRIHSNGGMMRVCGLSPANQRVLATCRLTSFFPTYGDRHDAVMDRTPALAR